MRRSFGSRRISPTPMPASSTARSIPAMVNFHAASPALTFSTSGASFPAAFLKSSASPSKNRAPPSPPVQCHAVASSAPPFRAGSRLLNEGQDSYSFALWRRYGTFFGFVGAAFFILRISHQTVLNCSFLNRLKILLPSSLSKACPGPGTNETHHVKTGQRVPQSMGGHTSSPRSSGPDLRSSRG